ncbi:MAG: hypothetical protein M3294_01890 [Pseudomonadota bacterium]|nr:hypothetical protein [Pseudomonadota bacterium]
MADYYRDDIPKGAGLDRQESLRLPGQRAAVSIHGAARQRAWVARQHGTYAFGI